MLFTYFIIFLLLIAVIFQVFTINKYRRLFRELSNEFSKDKELGYAELIDRIISYREVNRPVPPSEVIELISNYVKELFVTSRVFIHLTNNKEIAEKIMAEGFMYSESFYKSSEEISPNQIDLIYKLQIYKFYGNFVIIMCIPYNLFQNIDKEKLGKSLDQDILSDYGISEYYPDMNLGYKLPSRFVRGYIDLSTKQIVENPSFYK
jgi:hypothetical protein